MRIVQRRIGLCIAALTSLMCAVSSSFTSHPPAVAGQDYVKFRGEVQKVEERDNCIHHRVRVTDVVQAPSGYPLKLDKEVYVVWCKDWAGKIDKVAVGDFVEVLGPVDWGLVYDLAQPHHYMKKVPRDIKFRGTVTQITGDYEVQVEQIIQDPTAHLNLGDLAWITPVLPSCVKGTIAVGDYVEVYARATAKLPGQPQAWLEKDYHYIMKVEKTKPTSEDVVFRGTVTQTTEGYKVRVEQIMQDSTGHLILGELAWLTPVLPSCVKGIITVGDYVEVCGEAKPKLPGQLQVVELEKDYHYIKKFDGSDGSSFWFAIITDLHIGRSDPFDCKDPSYYLRVRLEKAINDILMQETKPAFVIVLGDISEHGKREEFESARDILSKLNEAGIPYIPIVGNHDVPGEEDFYSVFWLENERNSFLCYERLRNFIYVVPSNVEAKRGIGSVRPISSKRSQLINGAFGYGGIDFVFLDFCGREESGEDFLEAWPYQETLAFLRERLLTSAKVGRPVIIFAHHPAIVAAKGLTPYFAPCFYPRDLAEVLTVINGVAGARVKAWYGGHIHAFKPLRDYASDYYSNREYEPEGERRFRVVLTEALMRGSNRGAEETGPAVIRRVEIRGSEVIDTKLFGIYGAMNPGICYGRSWYATTFVADCFTERTIVDRRWHIADGDAKCVQQGLTGSLTCYNLDEGKHYRVSLTVSDDAGVTETIEIKVRLPALSAWLCRPNTDEVSAVVKAYQENTPSEFTYGRVPTAEEVFEYLDHYFKR